MDRNSYKNTNKTKTAKQINKQILDTWLGIVVDVISPRILEAAL